MGADTGAPTTAPARTDEQQTRAAGGGGMVNMKDDERGNGAAAAGRHERQDSDSDGGSSTPRGSRGFNMALNTDDTNLTVQAKDIESLRSAQRSTAAGAAAKARSPPGAQAADGEEAARPRRSSREKSKDLVHKSLSATLKSISRNAGPHIRTGTYTSKTSHVETASDDVPLSDSRLKPTWVMHNLSPAELCERAVTEEDTSHFSREGALMVLSGAKTGRSPKDKHVVREVNTEHDIWWGHESPNTPVDEEYFLSNRERALDYVRAGRRGADARRAAAATTLTAAAPPSDRPRRGRTHPAPCERS